MEELGLAPLRGAVLVGGESRRFGAPKQLARFAGSTFGARVAEALARLAGPPLVVGAGALPPELESLPRVLDRVGLRGPIAGILGALTAFPEGALLAAACDQPLISAEALDWLVSRRRAGTIAVVARFEAGGIEPLPAIYEPSARRVLEDLAAAGGSLQPLGRRADVVVVAPPTEFLAAWTSIDTEARRRELEAELTGTQRTTIAARRREGGTR
jgi:molybdopterin-guanine dinucleotide biosynthesis protein A